jgi:hypothetical protein
MPFQSSNLATHLQQLQLGVTIRLALTVKAVTIQLSGLIFVLELLGSQVRFRLDINDEHICDYIADFCYEELRKDGLWWSVVEDVKGMKTEVYKLKRRLMLAVHNVQILET